MRTKHSHGIKNTKGARDKGFAILEVIVAISILSVGLLAIASMQSASISGNSFASDLTEGTTWACDRLEALIRLGVMNYNDPNNLQDVDGDGDAGLDDTGADADYQMTQGRYLVNWNISENSVVNHTKTIEVIVIWTDHGVQKDVSILHVIAGLT